VYQYVYTREDDYLAVISQAWWTLFGTDVLHGCKAWYQLAFDWG